MLPVLGRSDADDGGDGIREGVVLRFGESVSSGAGEAGGQDRVEHRQRGRPAEDARVAQPVQEVPHVLLLLLVVVVLLLFVDAGEAPTAAASKRVECSFGVVSRVEKEGTSFVQEEGEVVCFFGVDEEEGGLVGLEGG